MRVNMMEPSSKTLKGNKVLDESKHDRTFIKNSVGEQGS
jgi:hypothetical protein